MTRVVIDTSVVVSALLSRRGASFAILREIGISWIPVISVPLILEYEAVGKRDANGFSISSEMVDTLVGAFCSIGVRVRTYYRLRPFLPDPGDEFIVDLAVAGRAQVIVTHNTRHFAAVKTLGIGVMTPAEFLRTMVRGRQ